MANTKILEGRAPACYVARGDMGTAALQATQLHIARYDRVDFMTVLSLQYGDDFSCILVLSRNVLKVNTSWKVGRHFAMMYFQVNLC